MDRENKTFWALAVSFVFGVSMNWPTPLRIITILLSGTVMIRVVDRLFTAYGPNGRE